MTGKPGRPKIKGRQISVILESQQLDFLDEQPEARNALVRKGVNMLMESRGKLLDHQTADQEASG